MAWILNIETTAQVCSVALSHNGQMAGLQECDESNSHAAQLTLLIQELMGKFPGNLEQLDAIAISSGPGSYTGLRIGYSVAKALCYTLDKPLIAINTLQS